MNALGLTRYVNTKLNKLARNNFFFSLLAPKANLRQDPVLNT